MHGGTIHLSSTIGVGRYVVSTLRLVKSSKPTLFSTFTVVLPLGNGHLPSGQIMEDSSTDWTGKASDYSNALVRSKSSV
jgi:hypothetical protein